MHSTSLTYNARFPRTIEAAQAFRGGHLVGSYAEVWWLRAELRSGNW